jgi:hypothetical protein
MKNLRAVTRDVLQAVEERTGKAIQFLRDENLSVLATLQTARNGADFHVLRYKPSNEPLDYLIVFQAGFVLRLFENDPFLRFDFSPASDAGRQVEVLMATGQPLTNDDKQNLPDFAKFVAEWALLNLRSLPVGMRIDQWIADKYPELHELQRASITLQQQQNTAVLSYRLGRLAVPMTLIGAVAAYALFADRLIGSGTYAIPYEAAGVIEHGRELLRLWDETPKDAQHDSALVDCWANASGMSDWYDWIPYKS